MARKTAAEKHAAKPLHFMTTGGGKPPICGIPRSELPFWSFRGVHVAMVSAEHLADPMVCPACVAAEPEADHSLPSFLA